VSVPVRPLRLKVIHRRAFYRHQGRGPLSFRSGLAIFTALALALTACGDDSSDGSSGAKSTAPTSPPVATAPSATELPPDATGPSTAPPGGAEHTGRDQDQAGGEEPVRVDAQFTVRGGRVSPRTVTTPAFLAVQVSVANLDGISRVVVVRTNRDYRLNVGPGRRATKLIPGQPAGSYPVLVQGRRRGALVFGGEPGP
jgi:hypothetical protein